MSGKSLLPFLLGGKTEPDRMIVTETSTQEAFGIRSPEFKYIYYRSDPGKAEFYHIPFDPAEKGNVISEYPAQSEYFRVALLKMLDENKALVSRLNLSPERAPAVDAETEEELKALGYVN